PLHDGLRGHPGRGGDGRPQRPRQPGQPGVLGRGDPGLGVHGRAAGRVPQLPPPPGPAPPHLLGYPPLEPLKEHLMSTPEPDDPQEPSPEPGPEPEAEPSPPVPPAATSGAGTPLGLLHAFPLDRRMWAPPVEALAGTYQVIVPDLRGFGAARDQAVEEAGMDLLADDLARLLDDRGLDRVVLGGRALGRLVALAFARPPPGRRARGRSPPTPRPPPGGAQGREAGGERAGGALAEASGFVPEAML